MFLLSVQKVKTMTPSLHRNSKDTVFLGTPHAEYAEENKGENKGHKEDHRDFFCFVFVCERFGSSRIGLRDSAGLSMSAFLFFFHLQQTKQALYFFHIIRNLVVSWAGPQGFFSQAIRLVCGPPVSLVGGYYALVMNKVTFLLHLIHSELNYKKSS